MIRNFLLKMEEKHMESLYCLMNINMGVNKSKIQSRLPELPPVLSDSLSYATV